MSLEESLAKLKAFQQAQQPKVDVVKYLKREDVFWIECLDPTQIPEALKLIKWYYKRKDRKVWCNDPQCQIRNCKDESHGLGYASDDVDVSDDTSDGKIQVVCRSRRLYVQRPSLYQFFGHRKINVRIGIK